MATVTLTQRFSNLDDWPGNLFAAGDGTGTVVSSRSATSMVVTLGDGTPFPGYEIRVTGTGFRFKDGIAIAGTMTQVQVVNDSGLAVVTFSDLGGSDLAKDLSQFYHNLFGSPDPEAGPGGDGKLVWSHLLAGSGTVMGTAGDDQQSFTGLDAGNDTYLMKGGDDRVTGGIGNDTYAGGAGFDTLTFQDTTWNEGMAAVRGATFNVAAGTVLDPWGGTDRISGFEYFEGSRFNDVYNGRANAEDYFAGLRGRDRIDGGANSFVDGERSDDDWDWVDYGADHWQGGAFGIVADLETSFSGGSIRGVIRDGFGNADVVIDVEHIWGTRYADSFTGSRVDNRFGGGEGKDTYVGGAGADRVILEGSFMGAEPDGAIVDLNLASGQIVNDGFGNTETVTGIEQVDGTNGADSLKMNAQENWIQGMDGGDTMTGRGGSDVFCFISEDELDDGDRITDFDTTGADADRLVFDSQNFEGMTLTVRIVNGTTATTNLGTFLYDAANDTLYWDSDGTGSDGPREVAVLDNVASLSASHFELY